MLILITPVECFLNAQYEHINIKINPIIIFILNSWYINAEKPETMMQNDIIKKISIIFINIIFINLFLSYNPKIIITKNIIISRNV